MGIFNSRNESTGVELQAFRIAMRSGAESAKVPAIRSLVGENGFNAFLPEISHALKEVAISAEHSIETRIAALKSIQRPTDVCAVIAQSESEDMKGHATSHLARVLG